MKRNTEMRAARNSFEIWLLSTLPSSKYSQVSPPILDNGIYIISREVKKKTSAVLVKPSVFHVGWNITYIVANN